MSQDQTHRQSPQGLQPEAQGLRINCQSIHTCKDCTSFSDCIDISPSDEFCDSGICGQCGKAGPELSGDGYHHPRQTAVRKESHVDHQCSCTDIAEENKRLRSIICSMVEQDDVEALKAIHIAAKAHLEDSGLHNWRNLRVKIAAYEIAGDPDSVVSAPA